MTLLQLKYVFECYRTASITAAADSLFTSVSNISKNLKNIEQELGFSVFERSPHGLIPTEPGKILLEHIRVILKESDEIYHITEKLKTRSLILASIPVVCSFRAFSKLVSSMQSDQKHMKFHSTTSDHALARLSNRLCDAALVGIHASKSTISSNDHLRQTLLQKYTSPMLHGISFVKVGSIQYSVYLSKQHPLLQQYKEDSQVLSHLLSYPYVEYNDDVFLNDNPIKRYVSLNQQIKVNDRDWRFTLLKEGDSFSSGITAAFLADKYPWMKTIPIPDGTIDLYLAYQESASEKTLILQFQKLIETEIRLLTAPVMNEKKLALRI